MAIKQLSLIKTVDKKFKQGTSFMPVVVDGEAKNMFNHLLQSGLNGAFRSDAELKKVINDYTKMIFMNAENNFKTLYTKKIGVVSNLKNSDFKVFDLKELSLKKINKVSDIVIKNEASKTLAVFDSFFTDIKKNTELGTLDENKKQLEERAKMIEDCESARLSNEATKQIALGEGFDSWVWGASSSLNPREEHEQYYGDVFDINETPAEGLPGEAVNCNCQMIFIKSA